MSNSLKKIYLIESRNDHLCEKEHCIKHSLPIEVAELGSADF
jgi:hypothetical protein